MLLISRQVKPKPADIFSFAGDRVGEKLMEHALGEVYYCKKIYIW